MSRKARESGAFPILTWQTRKKPFDTMYDLYKMKQSHWLLCVGKELWLVKANHATVSLDSSVASRGVKTYSEGRIELRNQRRVESVFVIRSARWAEKLGCCLEYCRSWKTRSENLWLWSIWRPFDSSFESVWMERIVSDGENLCHLWSVILKSVWNGVGDTF